MTSKLVFIYSANSGTINGLMDLAHKTISPTTYKCNLCKVTYDFASQNQEWKKFLGTLDHEVEFLYKDQLEKYSEIDKKRLPAVYYTFGDEVRILIDNKGLDKVLSVNELIELIKSEISNT